MSKVDAKFYDLFPLTEWLEKNFGYDFTVELYRKLEHFSRNSRDEWPSGLYSLRQVTEVKLGRVRSNSGWVNPGELGGLTSQLTSSYLGRDAKLGVQCLDAACTEG